MRRLLVVIVVAIHLQTALAARILALCALPSPSHSLWCYRYMALLAERGHQITVFGVDEPKFKIPNLTTFIANDVYNKFPDPTTFIPLLKDNIGYNIRGYYFFYKTASEIALTAVMHSKALKELIKHYENKEKPFDLIIHDSGNFDIPLGLVHLFGNPPLILATTYGSPQWMTFRAGNVFNPAYVPSMLLPFDQHMTFYERSINTIYYVLLELLFRLFTEPFEDRLTREVLGPNVPSLKDIAKKANVIIVNHHFALGDPRPMLPGVVGISGLHISEPKPLPLDIKDFIDKAEHGFILFSLGTNVNSMWLPGIERVISEALGQLPQRVLWKWDKIIPNISSNIKMSKWLPQEDILGHPKLCLFVTHCGLLSTQEAIYHRVPVLALPVFLDQTNNAASLVRHNLTIQLDPHKLTADELRDGITEILTNPMYKTNMGRMSDLMRDTPLTAQQQAVYWTEYAIRHQGAAHLHSVAADLPWHQLLLIDVTSIFLILSIVILWLVKILVTFLLRKLQLKKKKKSNKK